MGSTGKDEVFTKVEGPIIVGGGPSGIAVVVCLKHNGIPSLVLEKDDCIASLWQHKAYASVKLHLPKQLCELPMLGYPKNYPKYPTKNQFIVYVTAYADHFAIKPLFNQKVESAGFELERGVWRVKTQDSGYESRWLVVATGENAEALVPEIPGAETFEGRVMHASEYKNGREFRGKKVVVIGCGNSGMKISLDLCNHDSIPFMVVRNSYPSFTARTTGISNPIRSPSFRLSVSVSAQQSAFAVGVLSDLYAFHRSTGNSLCPYRTPAW
ncbi:hypothetical protein E3N88_43610 [Mikania micrantha]|uniref:indole-3-pyruvate monooxygenase n=1 Tax=Mikania micrantha TaxID=192012 RepID=A0A5N6LGN0_9ASTR|nr:hypothetical protein E3N88_43610 [Mikania micrantha]